MGAESFYNYEILYFYGIEVSLKVFLNFIEQLGLLIDIEKVTKLRCDTG